MEQKIPLARRITGQIRRSTLRRFFREHEGQDLIEYALMAGFVAVAAGAIFPTSLMPAVSTIFSQLTSSFLLAGS